MSDWFTAFIGSDKKHRDTVVEHGDNGSTIRPIDTPAPLQEYSVHIGNHAFTANQFNVDHILEEYEIKDRKWKRR
jgi:hypothetical protein